MNSQKEMMCPLQQSNSFRKTEKCSIQEMVCINCPMSCHMVVEYTKNRIIRVTGNTCPRGSKYAHDEMIHPTRVVTSTVYIKNAAIERLPVMTAAPIPKNKIFDVMKQINKVKVKAPVKMNDVIIENVCRTGVNVIATRSMDSIK